MSKQGNIFTSLFGIIFSPLFPLNNFFPHYKIKIYRYNIGVISLHPPSSPGGWLKEYDYILTSVPKSDLSSFNLHSDIVVQAIIMKNVSSLNVN